MKVDKFFGSFDLVRSSSVKFGNIDSFNTSYFDDFDGSELRDEDGYDKLVQRYVLSRIDGSSAYREHSLARKLLSSYVADQVMLMRIYKRPLFETPRRSFYPGGCCIPGVTRCFVTAMGELFPCERVNINDSRVCIGNAESDIQLDKSLGLIEQVTDLFQKNCRDCWACRLCNVCYAAIWKANEGQKDLRVGSMQKLCGAVRRQIGKALKLFCFIMERNPNAFDDWQDTGIRQIPAVRHVTVG